MSNDVTDLRFFVTLADSGSLVEAARRSDVTASAISQRLRQLEERIGIHLINRNTRRFNLTDEGAIFYSKAVSLLAEIDSLIDSLRSRSGEIAGTLHVRGPLGFGRHYLAPALSDFQTINPRLLVSLTLSDVLPAADAERFDMIVHIGELSDSSMIAYPIAPNGRIVCASPQYLAMHPAPGRPEELSSHQCIVLRENDEDVSLCHFRKGQQELTVRIAPKMSSNDGEVTRGWALSNKGIIMRSEWDVALCLASGQLVRLLSDWQLPNADIVALLPQRHGVPARVKAFLAFLQERFQPVPPWRLEI